MREALSSPPLANGVDPPANRQCQLVGAVVPYRIGRPRQAAPGGIFPSQGRRLRVVDGAPVLLRPRRLQ
jgi:hypothetical protein